MPKLLSFFFVTMSAFLVLTMLPRELTPLSPLAHDHGSVVFFVWLLSMLAVLDRSDRDDDGGKF